MNEDPAGLPRRWPARVWWVMATGLSCGALVWGLSIPLTGSREPFDSTTPYYPIALYLSGVLATWPAPRYWWLAVAAIFLGEHLYAIALYPEARAWLPFGLLINLMIPTWWPAAMGAISVRLLDMVRTRRSSTDANGTH